MNTTDASTDAVSAHDGTRQRGAATGRCAAGSEPMAGEMRLTIGDIDFSRVNLQYLICARDLARVDPERATVLLGIPDDLVQLLAELEPAALVAVTEVRVPLLVLRQEPWWWHRLFTALQADRPDELRAVLEQAGLMVAGEGPRGNGA
jgi:hypothetical protein